MCLPVTIRILEGFSSRTELKRMKFTTYILLLTLLLTSCYEDREVVVEDKIVEVPEVFVAETKVVGQVHDEYGQLISDIDIEFSGMNKPTELPYFYFEAENINKYYEVLHYTHPSGMLLGVPLQNLENTINYHDLYIPSAFKTYEYTSDMSIDIELRDGLDFTLEAQALNKPAGIYDGTVEILTKYLDPTNHQDHRLIPQFLHRDAFQQNRYLDVQDVFILGISGEEHQDVFIPFEKLTWSSNQTLYFFDVAAGYWKEIDSNFQYISGYYAIGESLASRYVELETVSNKKIQGLEVLYNIDDQLTTRQRLSSNNRAIVHLPSNAELRAEVRNTSVELGQKTFAVGTEAYSINLDFSTNQLRKLDADLRDCSDEKVQDGLLLLESETASQVFYLESNAAIYLVEAEDKKAEFSLYSTDFNHQSSAVTVDIKEETRLGRQYFCDGINDEYLVFHIEGNHKIFTDINYIIVDDLTTVTGSESNGATLSLRFELDMDGFIGDTKANIELFDAFLGDGYRLNCFTSSSGCGFEEFVITQYGEDMGGYVKGKFKGLFWIESIGQENVGYRFLNGEFQFKR